MDNDADLICVFGGINDFWHGTAPLGTMQDRTKTTFYGALHVLFSGLLNKYPTSSICTFTPLKTYGITGNGLSLDEISNAIIEVAKYYCIPVFDLYNIYGWNPEVNILKQTYIPDAIHPNDVGSLWIATRLAKFLDTI